MLCKGATGLIFFSWFDIRRNPDVPFDVQWGRMKKIAAEIDGLTPVLLSIDPTPAVDSIVSELPQGVLLLSKSHDDKLYLFAVNDGSAEAPTEVTVKFNVKTSKPIRVLGEGRTITPTADGFSDKSEKLSVHIYEIVL